MRYMITDELWAVMGPLVKQAKRYTCGQPPKLPDRAFFEAVLYVGRTGVPWRDLPGEFGAWDAVYNQFRRWVSTGSLAKLFELLTDGPEFDGHLVDFDLLMDRLSTYREFEQESLARCQAGTCKIGLTS